MSKFFSRIEKARELLSFLKTDLLLIEDPINLYYLTGLSLSKGQLLISKNKTILIVDNRYFLHAKKNFPFDVRLSSEINFSQTVFDTFKKTKTIGFEAPLTSYSHFLELKQAIKSMAKTLKPLPNVILENIRCLKEEGEIKKIKEASKLTDEGFDFAKALLKEGIKEHELVNELLTFWLSRGAEKAFNPIFAFGDNSASPHHLSKDRRLKKGDIVLIDIGAKKDGYCSDMTRVLFFGEPKKKLISVYNSVLRAQEKGLSLAKPQYPLKDLNQAVRDELEKDGYAKYFTHGLGHGVGLEIHECPSFSSKIALKDGMVLTIEPGVYIPGLGGVRIEDTVLVQKKGIQILTKSSKELCIID